MYSMKTNTQQYCTTDGEGTYTIIPNTSEYIGIIHVDIIPINLKIDAFDYSFE